VLDIDPLLERLWFGKGTDMLLTAGSAPFMRFNGDLRLVQPGAALDVDDLLSMLDRTLSPAQMVQYKGGDEVDFSFEWRALARIRGNAFRRHGVPAVSFRMVPRAIPSFDDLLLPASVRRLAALRQGLVFVTGPTGSGKSTTLAALIGWVNQNRPTHIITIEDPIEYVYDQGMAAVSQREVGTDTRSFATALRSALREDPDVIMVGEVRDLESIRFALTLAETGHLVFATLHTNDTAQAIDRLIDIFPSEQQPQIRVQLANALSAVVYQRLLPLANGQGSVAAHEVLIANNPVRNLIKEGKTNQLRNQLVTGQNVGSQTLEQSLSALVQAGMVTLELAESYSLHPREISK
jgi:twitching motility protein PilT